MINEITNNAIYIAGAALVCLVIFNLAAIEFIRWRDKRLKEAETDKLIKEMASNMVLVRKARKLSNEIEKLERSKHFRKRRKAASTYPNSK